MTNRALELIETLTSKYVMAFFIDVLGAFDDLWRPQLFLLAGNWNFQIVTVYSDDTLPLVELQDRYKKCEIKI